MWCDYVPYSKLRFHLIDFQLNIDSCDPLMEINNFIQLWSHLNVTIYFLQFIDILINFVIQVVFAVASDT